MKHLKPDDLRLVMSKIRCIGGCASWTAVALMAVIAGCSGRKSPDNATLVNQRIGTNSYASIVVACRSLLPQHTTVLPRELDELRKQDVDITLYPSYRYYDKAVPSILRGVGIRSISVNRDFVLLHLDCRDRRLALLGFREGATTFGTAQLTNGLWYWSGEGGFPITYPAGRTFK